MSSLKVQDIQYMNIMNNQEVSFLLNLFKFPFFKNKEIIHHIDGVSPYFLYDRYFTRYEIMNNKEYHTIRNILTVLWYASINRYTYKKFWQFLFETDGYIGSSENDIESYIKNISDKLLKIINDDSVINERVSSYLCRISLYIKKQLFDYSVYTLKIDLYETLYRSLYNELTTNDLEILNNDKMVGILVCDAIDLNNDKKQFLSEIKKRDLYF